MRLPFLTLLLLPVAVSCADSYLDGVLDRAEALMDERPDSSLALLGRLDRSGIGTPALRARYALDYAMALDKNWVDTTDVSIIEPALRHYRRTHGRKERFLSRYYYARMLENGESMEDAIDAFSAAEDCFGGGVDSVYLIRIAAARSRIYAGHLANDKAEAALLEAVRLAVEQRDAENGQRMMLSLADLYGATGRISRKDSVLSGMGAPLPGLELRKARSVAGLVFSLPGDSVRFADDWRLFRETADMRPDLLDRDALAGYLLFRRRHADVRALLSRVRPDSLPLPGQIAYWGQMAEASEGLGEYEDAYRALGRYSSLFEEMSYEEFRSDIRSREERYRGELERYGNRLKVVLLSMLAVLLGAVLAAALRKKRKKEEMLSDLRKEYEMSLRLRETELARNERFARRLDKRLTALKPYITDDFPDELYDSAGLRRMTEDTKQMLGSIGFLFGLYHPRFILELEEKGLSELEIGYCCLYALGFTGKEIPGKLQRNSFYNTSSDIRRKIGLGPHDTNLSIWIRNLYGECENE